MTYFFRLLLVNEWRHQYPSKKYLFAHLVAVLLGLLAYWFTSEAIGPVLKGVAGWEGLNYFQYVVVGELFISLPAACLQIFVRAVHHLHQLNNLEDLILNHKNPVSSLYQVAGSLLLRELLYLIVWLAAALFAFQLQTFYFVKFFNLIFMLFATSLFFLQVGFVCAMIYMIVGRGQGVISQASYFFSLLAGVFFPTTVMTQNLGQFITYLSPYTFYIQSVRAELADKPSEHLMYYFILILISILSLIFFKKLFSFGAVAYLKHSRFTMSQS
jgi:ABC-type polysaccharide/polyol phosphate export permease